MINRRWARFCSASRQFERSLGGLVIGICIGLLLGICFMFENQVDIEQRLIEQPSHEIKNASVWIRCVVIIQVADPRPHKYIRSILDTYAKRCNKTVIFTNEEKLLPKFHGKGL
jgi:hypothetical protein